VNPILIACWIIGMLLHLASRMVDWRNRNKDAGRWEYLSFLLRGDFLLSQLSSLVLLTLWLSGADYGIIPPALHPNWATALLLGYVSDSLTKTLTVKLFGDKLSGFRLGGIPASLTKGPQ
jgi:hypothetical protein